MRAGYGGKRPFNYFVFGAAVSEVELDVLTGETCFQRMIWGPGEFCALLLSVTDACNSELATRHTVCLLSTTKTNSATLFVCLV